MSYYANSEERAGLIAGLRDLADFLDQNPQVPAPRCTDLLVFPPAGSDAEMFAEIDVIAEQIGATASDADSPAGHYSASRDFGPVQYRAVAIPHGARTPRTRRRNSDAAPDPLLRRPRGRGCSRSAWPWSSSASTAASTASGSPAGPTASAKRSPAGCSSARAAATPTTPRTAGDEQDDRPHRRRGRLRPALHRARLRASAAPGPAGCAARRGAPASPRTVPPATGRGDVR